MAIILYNYNKEKYVHCLLALIKIQNLLFPDLSFPQELNKLIIMLSINIIRGIECFVLRKQGLYYEEMNYTLYREPCSTPKDHTWEQLDNCWKTTCKCKFGIYDKIIEFYGYTETDYILEEDIREVITKRDVNYNEPNCPEFTYETSYWRKYNGYTCFRHFRSPERIYAIEYGLPGRYSNFYKKIETFFNNKEGERYGDYIIIQSKKLNIRI